MHLCGQRQIGLKISQKKTEVMTLDVQNPQSVKVNFADLPTTEEFTVRHDGEADTDIMRRLAKAKNAFRMLSNVWKSQQFNVQTTLKLYQNCVLSTLVYGSECWSMIASDRHKLSVFHTKNLRRIRRIYRLNIISNKELLGKCKQN